LSRTIVQDYFDSAGILANARLGQQWQRGNWNLNGYVGVRYYSPDISNYWFGITAEEATERFPSYTAKQAFVPEAEVGASYPLTRDWVFATQFRVSSMCSSGIAKRDVAYLLALAAILASNAHSAWAQSGNNASELVPATTKAILNANPVTCVALHKDQVCFQQITLSWSQLAPGDYCLYIEDVKRPLTCWFDNTLNSFVHEYESADSIRYELREGSSDDSMATVSVNTSWVYRTGRRSSSGWRLF